MTQTEKRKLEKASDFIICSQLAIERVNIENLDSIAKVLIEALNILDSVMNNDEDGEKRRLLSEVEATTE